MKLLVTGAAGMLGRDVMLAAGNAGHEVVGYGRAEFDVTDPSSLGRRLELERPDVVINCAAWTDVDGAESAEEAAFAVNGAGAGNVAAGAAELGAAVVYASTDYVFGGDNFVETMLRLGALQSEVTVVRDQVASPTYTWHLAYGIVRLIEGVEFGIHHMAAAGQCSWYEFANEIFEQAKVECKVLSITSDEFGAAAPRPAFSALVSQREHAIRLPSWQDGLAGYLAQRQAEAGTE